MSIVSHNSDPYRKSAPRTKRPAASSSSEEPRPAPRGEESAEPAIPLPPPDPRDLFDPLAAVPAVEDAPASLAGGDYGGTFTFLPRLVDRERWERGLLPDLRRRLSPPLYRFVREKGEQILRVRDTLRRHRKEFLRVLGPAGFTDDWLQREARSSDSMEYRCLTTEAVATVYSERQLQRLVALCTRLDVPMIPYGEGGGYNMGVVPMAGALTVSLKGLCAIGPVRPLDPDEERRFGRGRSKITAGAGAPWSELMEAAARAGKVLRCRPNTPRASVGGIAGTGAHAGRRVQEVIVEGRAVIRGGRLFRFAPTERELRLLPETAFLAVTKFWGVGPEELQAIRRAAQPASEAGVGTPFLPLSLFAGAEGCTGIISKITLLLDTEPAWRQTLALAFAAEGEAFAFARRVKGLPPAEQPPFFEAVTRQAIVDFLGERFPGQLRTGDQGYLVLEVEGDSREEAERRSEALIRLAPTAGCRLLLSPARPAGESSAEAEALKAPREELPKLLRTKCKTDPEIRLEYLEAAAALLHEVPETARRRLEGEGIRLASLLFGHLSLPRTAILHWNVGGFDIYDETQARLAWALLAERMERIAELGLPGEGPSAAFTGEHGMAGKAPLLFLGHASEEEFQRIAAVKEAVDPGDLFNPMTLFLRSRLSRQVHARLLAHSHRLLREAAAAPSPAAHALEEARRCTRCNACKICPVIDAEARLRGAGAAGEAGGLPSLFFRRGLLPSKRDLLLGLEKAVCHAAAAGAGLSRPEGLPHELASLLSGAAGILHKCFYCRRCDGLCPVDIDLHALAGAWRGLAGLPATAGGNPLIPFLYDRLLGPDPLRGLYYRAAGIGQRAGMPLASLLRRSRLLPSWLKTYVSIPPFALRRYRPARHGRRVEEGDNFFVIGSPAGGGIEPTPGLIRFRGCMDSWARGRASRAADIVLGAMAGLAFADLEADLCCGFPWKAAGLPRGEATQAAATIAELLVAAGRLHGRGARVPLTVFSNCPTCQEAIREGAARFDEEGEFRSRVLDLLQGMGRWEEARRALEAGGGARGVFRVRDAAEPAAERLLDGRGVGGGGQAVAAILGASAVRASTGAEGRIGPDGRGGTREAACPGFEVGGRSSQSANRAGSAESPALAGPGLRRLPDLRGLGIPGLKVPCHNTPEATAAQMALLRAAYGEAEAYSECCGLSGSARLLHPRIGTEVAAELLAEVARRPVARLVSGCPACRDGAEMQRLILRDEGGVGAEEAPPLPTTDLFNALLG